MTGAGATRPQCAERGAPATPNLSAAHDPIASSRPVWVNVAPARVLFPSNNRLSSPSTTELTLICEIYQPKLANGVRIRPARELEHGTVLEFGVVVAARLKVGVGA